MLQPSMLVVLPIIKGGEFSVAQPKHKGGRITLNIKGVKGVNILTGCVVDAVKPWVWSFLLKNLPPKAAKFKRGLGTVG